MKNIISIALVLGLVLLASGVVIANSPWDNGSIAEEDVESSGEDTVRGSCGANGGSCPYNDGQGCGGRCGGACGVPTCGCGR